MGKLTLNKILNYKKIKDIKNQVTEKQILELNSVIEKYDTYTIKNRLTNIRDFILCNVEDDWLNRLDIIVNKLGNDCISEYSCKIRYGEKWEEKRNNLIEKVKVDKNFFISKYGLEKGEEKWKERNSKLVSYGLNAAVKRYGLEEGKKRWEKTLSQKIESMKESKKIRPYRNGRTLSEYQNRYGVELGYKKWKERNIKQSIRFSKQYYIDKYGDEQGQVLWNEYCVKMNKTTLDSFIERYGEKIGVERYDLFINKIKEKNKESFFIEKYGEENGKVKYKEFITKKISNFKDKYSKISQDLFWNIYKELKQSQNCYFYELNHEYVFYVWNNDMTIINVDFRMDDKIIEFDGDFWHSSEKQIDIDKKRDYFLISKGYKIKRVKEKEYRKDKNKIINECIKFLKNEK
jgi:hypothetical protein